MMTGEFELSIPRTAQYSLANPPKANWEFCFFGDWYALKFQLYFKKPPSRFFRFTQRVLLGIHWRKIT